MKRLQKSKTCVSLQCRINVLRCMELKLKCWFVKDGHDPSFEESYEYIFVTAPDGCSITWDPFDPERKVTVKYDTPF